MHPTRHMACACKWLPFWDFYPEDMSAQVCQPSTSQLQLQLRHFIWLQLNTQAQENTHQLQHSIWRFTIQSPCLLLGLCTLQHLQLWTFFLSPDSFPQKATPLWRYDTHATAAPSTCQRGLQHHDCLLTCKIALQVTAATRILVNSQTHGRRVYMNISSSCLA